MTRLLLRFVVYGYVAAGALGLLVGFVITPFVFVIALALIAANWESLGRPMSARRWIPLVMVATLGLVRVVFLPPPAASGLLS